MRHDADNGLAHVFAVRGISLIRFTGLWKRDVGPDEHMK